MFTFAADYKTRMEMKQLNLLNGLIIIRLQGAGGSDRVCI